MIKEQDLQFVLDARRQELTQEVVNLISQDAPKNKFSVIAGRLKMIEEIESEIPDLVKKTRDS